MTTNCHILPWILLVGYEWTHTDLILEFCDPQKLVTFFLDHTLIAASYICGQCQSVIDLIKDNLEF